MTDRYGEPDYDRWSEHDPELDQHDDGTDDEPTTRLNPSAREHLAAARAALTRPTDRRAM